jgi:hypothetical protein
MNQPQTFDPFKLAGDLARFAESFPKLIDAIDRMIESHRRLMASQDRLLDALIDALRDHLPARDVH